MTRSFLRSVCRMLVGVVLLAQMSIAAYACPMLSKAPGGGSATASSTVGDMAGMNCEGIAAALDPALPNLCAAHCHDGQQSDQSSTLTVPAVMLALRHPAPLAPEPLGAASPASAALGALAAAFPPHAILHCCFRI